MIPGDSAFVLSPEDLEDLRKAGLGSGLRSAKAPSSFGRHQRSVPVRPGEPVGELAVDATLRAAAIRSVATGHRPPLKIHPVDIHRRLRMSRSGRLILLVVDTSESMGAGAADRIIAAKGTVLNLLREAHLQRDLVGLITFRDRSARVVLPPTRSMDLARAHLQGLPVGGATPLAHALSMAWLTTRQERFKNPLLRPLLVLITDGEGNVPLAPGRSVDNDIRKMAARICADRIATVLIHTGDPKKHGPEMRLLASRMKGTYHRVQKIRPVDLTTILLSCSSRRVGPMETGNRL